MKVTKSGIIKVLQAISSKFLQEGKLQEWYLTQELITTFKCEALYTYIYYSYFKKEQEK